MKTADNSSHRGWRLYPGAAQSQLVLATRAGQAGASSSPDVTAAASCHRATVPTPGTMAAAAAAAATAATASAAGDPAGPGSGGSVTSAAASAVNTDRTRSARRVKARSQPRTVEAGRPSRPAITRCPAPAAFASSASPITSPASARRARHHDGSRMCVTPHSRHRDRRGTSHACPSGLSSLPGSRTRRLAPFPHLASTPPHDGQASSPSPNCRSTTSRSAFTVSTTPPRVNPAALPSPVARPERSGRAAPITDVITVPSHTKKDNPKAALKPVLAVSGGTRSLHPHPEWPGTPGPEVMLLRHERGGRGVSPEDQRAHPRRQVRGDLPGQGQRGLAVVGVPEEHSQLGQPDRVQPELELGDHAEVAAAAAQRPEQLRVLPGAGPAAPARRP